MPMGLAHLKQVFGAFGGGSDKKPFLFTYRSAKWFIEITVGIAAFTDIFLYGVIVPVIPFALETRAHVPSANVQHWVSILLAVYGGALLVASPFLGWFADKASSRRLPLLLGLILLAGATVMLCLGKSIAVLLVARMLQGFSAAVVWIVGLALLADTIDGDEAGQAMGIISLSYTMGVLLGPTLGGVVYARSGYYAVFYMLFAVIFVDIALRLVLIEKKVAARWIDSSAIDVPLEAQKKPAAVAGSSNAQPDTEAITTTDAEPPVLPSVDGREESVRPRVPPIFLLMRSPRLLAAVWATFVASVIFGAFDSTLPLFVHEVFTWRSLGGGLIFLPIVIPSFSGPIVGALVDKYGPRWLAAGGLILVMPFLVLLRLVSHDSMGQKVLLCALLTLIGIAVSLILPPVMAEFLYVVQSMERQRPGLFGAAGAYAQSYSMFNVAWATGALVGPVWGGYAKSRAGWGTMTWSLGAFAALSAVPIAIFTGGQISWRRRLQHAG